MSLFLFDQVLAYFVHITALTKYKRPDRSAGVRASLGSGGGGGGGGARVIAARATVATVRRTCRWHGNDTKRLLMPCAQRPYKQATQ